MGAQRDRIVWRYEFGQVVYLQGSREPYTIEAHNYLAFRDPPSRQRTYQLQDTQGNTFWIQEHHIYPTPAKQHDEEIERQP